MSGARSNAIAVSGVTKTYGDDVQALNGVTIDVEQGEFFGLLGPNGAGKSTLVRILATLTKPDSGQATVAGHDVLAAPGAVREHIGYVAQVSGVNKYDTGRENLALQAHLMRVPHDRIKNRVEELLDWVGLTDAGDRIVNTYSGGMKRRLDIAMGLVHKPRVLFLDEPSTGLDPETRTGIWRDLQRLQQDEQMTVLLTTHYLEEADHLCDRLAIIDHGQIIVTGTPADLKAEVQGDAVTLDVGNEVDDAVNVIRTLNGVSDIYQEGQLVTVRVPDGAQAVPALLSAVEHSGLKVQSVTLSRPSLDDVYLFYTGHHFAADVDDEPESSESLAAPLN